MITQKITNRGIIRIIDTESGITIDASSGEAAQQIVKHLKSYYDGKGKEDKQEKG